MTRPGQGSGPEVPPAAGVPVEPEGAPEPEAPSESEAPPESEPEPDLREEMEVLREDLRGTMAGTPGQRIRLMILMVVIVVVLLLALMALRASGSGPFADPAAQVPALLLSGDRDQDPRPG